MAISANQAEVDYRSDPSVTEHYLYLKQVGKQASARNGKKKDSATLDWWGSYQHWLHDHVNKQGIFDSYPYVLGAKHRDQLPPAHIVSEHGPVLIGAWSYVGPHNEQPVPGRLYDGLGPLTGRCNAIAVDPTNDNTLYVASPGGGVWKSLDRGVTWNPLSDKWQVMQTSSIAIDPNNHNTVYVGTGDYPQGQSYNIGVMKSVNGGTSWTNYGNAQFANLAISHIVVDPANSNVVILTAGRGNGGSGGIFRSINGGQTWTKAAAPSVNWDGLSSSVPDSLGHRTFWAAGSSLSGDNIYKSINDGATWTKVATPITGPHNAVDISCSKLSPSTVYILDPAAKVASSGNHIYKTVNGGATWADVIAGFPNGDPSDGTYYTWDQNNYNFYIGTSVITNGTIKTDGVFVGLITIAMSPNGGLNWRDVSKSYQPNLTALSHVDQHSFFADPIAPNTVYFGNDGGVHRMVYTPSTNVATFSPLNLNLYMTQWYFVAVHPTDQTRVMGGLQDNANPAATGNLSYWINPGQGDGSEVCYDPYNPLIAYNCTQNLGVYRTTNGWATYPPEDISISGTNETINQFPPIVTAVKSSHPSTLYAGTDHLWSWDPTNQWISDISGQALAGAGSQGLRRIATCPNDINRVYTGSDDGQLWEVKQLNLGVNAVAVEVDNGFAQGSPVVAISALPTNEHDLLAGTTQSGGANLFHCANVDAASPQWTDVTGTGATGLPPLPVNAVARDPYAPATTWYVGMDIGVFMTTNAGAIWTNMTNPLGLPNVAVNDLQVNATTGYLYAATYGRGLWRIKLAPPVPTIASLAFNLKTVVGGIDNPIGTVTLSGPATANYVVTLKSSDSYYAEVPASVTVPIGKASVQFTVTTYQPPSQETVTVTATKGNSKSASFTMS